MIVCRKREAAPRSLLRSATASLKLVQNELLTQLTVQTLSWLIVESSLLGARAFHILFRIILNLNNSLKKKFYLR